MQAQEEFERGFMEGTLDPFDFELALELHMTVQQLRERMSNQEYLQWRAFYVWRNAQIELERKVLKAVPGG